ncbi:MAG: hypothetical protein IPN86_17895 [Saprospiraceae bacterium]|nr:hypothetical protein [Saprospiraceae bacterium]
MYYIQKTLFSSLIILGFFFICPLISNGQKQVSNVQNYKQDDDHPRKGFINIGAKEYFIEQRSIGDKSLAN